MSHVCAKALCLVKTHIQGQVIFLLSEKYPHYIWTVLDNDNKINDSIQ